MIACDRREYIYIIYEGVFQLNKERRIVMKKLIQLLVVLCIFVLTGCKTNKERYLSITTSGYDKKGNEIVNIYEYSLSTKNVTKKYTSSNPLGVYSKSNCKSQYKNVGLGQYKNVGFPTFLYCLFSLHLL